MSTPLRERPDAPLGTLIFRAGLLPAETIESALEEGVKTGKRLGEILTERGLISEVDLARLLAGQKGLEFVTLREQIVDPSAATLFTEEQARLFRALPYSFDGELPVVAIADPTDDVLMRNIREALGRDDARFVVSARGELAEIATDVYSRSLPRPETAPPASVEEPVVHTEHLNGNASAHPEPIVQPPAHEPEQATAPEPEPFVPEPQTEFVAEAPYTPPAPEPEPVASPAPVPAEPVAADPLPQPEPEAQPEPQPEFEAEPEPQPVQEAQPQPEPAPELTPEPVAEPVAAHEPDSFAVAQPEAEPAPQLPVETTPAPQPAGPEPYEPPAAVEPPAAPEPEAPVQPEPVVETLPPAPEPFVPAETQPPVAHEPLRVAEPPATPEPALPAEPAAAVEPTPSLEPVPLPQPPAPPTTPFPPAATEPDPAPAAEPAPAEPSAPWRMTIRLTNGEHVEAGDFPDEASAKLEAKTIMSQVAEADDWPFVNGRFLKPDTIVSVDIAEHTGEDLQP